MSDSAQSAQNGAAPKNKTFLTFGIPSLDELLGPRPPGADGSAEDAEVGYELEKEEESTTFCLIGPDGTGKSLFALHMASKYLAQTKGKVERQKDEIKILYASTDLSHDRADRVWKTFWLDRPESRRRRLPFHKDFLPFEEPLRDPTETGEHRCPLELKEYRPIEEVEIFAAYLTGTEELPKPKVAFIDTEELPKPKVAFIDLESTTAGDDWNLLNTILAALPTPETGPRHMMIIDAIEGLETLVGERDAFGEKQDRRTRIAHIVRAAAGKCHLIFVVEEARDGARLPEVFVSDVVVRLRTTTDRDYARRTVEFEKVRAQAHVRGQHDFRVQQGPSYTRECPNPDEPKVGYLEQRKNNEKPLGKDVPHYLPYIQVFPSLHQLSHQMGTRGQAAPAPSVEEVVPQAKWRFAAFGNYQLDVMLAQALGKIGKYETLDLGKADLLAGADRMGLPVGSITTLIGNEATYKSQLARAFLSQCFRNRHIAGPRSDQAACTYAEVNLEDALRLGGQGVAVLLATYGTYRKELADLLEMHLLRTPDEEDLAPERGASRREARRRGRLPSRRRRRRRGASRREGRRRQPFDQRNAMETQVIVRRLETHHLPSAVFMHIVRRVIAEAKRILYLKLNRTHPEGSAEKEECKRKYDWRIRFVIDDWTTLLGTYPELHRDPLFIPYLMHYLRNEGVTSLILATQPGNPNKSMDEDTSRDIRELRLHANHHLYTWHVHFYGDTRGSPRSFPTAWPAMSPKRVGMS